ncbi:MAG: radical SAM protein, partial [Ignavibacteriales bacterium]
MKKRIVLIQPYPENSTGVGRSTGSFPPLGLLIIDALTPKDKWDVEIIDESRSRFDTSMDMSNISLVGISLWTNQAPRAYRIADVFRR